MNDKGLLMGAFLPAAFIFWVVFSWIGLFVDVIVITLILAIKR